MKRQAGHANRLVQYPLYPKDKEVPSLGVAPCTEYGACCLAQDQSTESYCDSQDTAEETQESLERSLMSVAQQHASMFGSAA